MIDAKKIWSSKHLPSLPTVAIDLVKLSKNPDTEVRDIIERVKTDPAISAKILKVINSAFFGLSTQVTSLERAVGLLGSTYVTSIALSFYLANSASSGGPLAEHYSRYWLQSVVQATAAEIIGNQAKGRNGSEFFLSGLMLDLGRLAMLKTIPEEYSEVLDAVEEKQRSLVEVERELLGFDHTEIGARLIESWKLPVSLSRFVENHHVDQQELPTDGEPQELLQVRALALASSVGEFFCAPQKTVALESLKFLGKECFDFDELGLEAYLNDVRLRIDQVSEQFSAQASLLADPAELMAEASEALVQLAVRENVASMHADARRKAVEQARCDLESENIRLQQQTSHDPLTELYSRRYFDEVFAAEAQRCVSTAGALGIIFGDIDNFKQLNDTYGHPVGDEILKQFARAFQESLRTSDILARYGGEEFVVLVSRPTVQALEKLSERVRSRIEAEMFHAEGHRISLTVSLGAAFDVPSRNDRNVEARLLAAADQEMYRAKKAGGNQTCTRNLVGDFQRRLGQLVTQRKFSRWLVAQQKLDVASVSRSLQQTSFDHPLIGQLAINLGVLTMAQVEMLLSDQDSSGLRLGEVALKLGLLTEDQLIDLLVLQEENPIALAETIARLGLACPRDLTKALADYLLGGSDVMRNLQTGLRSGSPV